MTILAYDAGRQIGIAHQRIATTLEAISYSLGPTGRRNSMSDGAGTTT